MPPWREGSALRVWGYQAISMPQKGMGYFHAAHPEKEQKTGRPGGYIPAKGKLWRLYDYKFVFFCLKELQLCQ
jgi:hypothetical protein